MDTNKCEFKNYCKGNSSYCKECDNSDAFEPKSRVERYFEPICSSKGPSYTFKTIGDDLRNTRYVLIGYTKYCPYCGEEMIPIQNRDYKEIGQYCICDAALTELEYKEIEFKLKQKHKEEMSELKNSYAKRLEYNLDKLREIKIKRDEIAFKRMSERYTKTNYFNTESTDINDIID